MNNKKNLHFAFAVLMTVLLAVSAGCANRSYRYYKASWLGRLQPGMSKEAVKELLGEPTGVERRQIGPNELREVWIYHVRDVDLRNHLYPALHLLVFRNGKMIAKDPEDPYSPKL